MSANRNLITCTYFVTALMLSNPILAAKSTTAAKANYDLACALCHGDDAKGAMPGVPDLTISESRLNQPVSVLMKNVVNGMPPRDGGMAMPPMGGEKGFSKNKIEKMIKFMKTKFLKK